MIGLDDIRDLGGGQDTWRRMRDRQGEASGHHTGRKHVKGKELGSRFGEEKSECNTVLRKFHQGEWGSLN